MNPVGRLGVACGCLLLGVLAAGPTVAVHSTWWGLLLGVGAALATAVWLPRAAWARLPFCAAWVATVLWLTPARADGSYLVGTDLSGYALLLAALVLTLVGLTGLLTPRVRGISVVGVPRP